jgi:nicotinate-nucleotide adenylyltransferase
MDAESLRGRRIGLLGGSFNPAHEGHLHISQQALRRLKLDQMWWVVSPQNPLKRTMGMAPFSERFTSAESVAAADPRILVTDIEKKLGTQYSIDTVINLTQTFPNTRFIWVMGADNLIQAARWRDWRTFFRAVPIAVFSRPTYSLRALVSKAARSFARARIRESRAGRLADMRPPAWVYLRIPMSSASATRIRTRRSA